MNVTALLSPFVKKYSFLIKTLISSAAALLCATMMLRAQEAVPPFDAFVACQQLVLVVGENWNATNATLQRFEQQNESWKPAAPPVVVNIGRSGMGWCLGVIPNPTSTPQKKEGDGRSPAGVFSLAYVFGKAPVDQMRDLRMPYVQCAASLECVDDTNSAYYNQVVDRTNVAKVDWRSSEKMAAPDEYRLGVVVNHNLGGVRGAGSCIFLHVWTAPGKPTSGCTSMPLGDLEALVAWLNQSSRPLLVQLPKSEYARLKGPWRLPELSTNSP